MRKLDFFRDREILRRIQSDDRTVLGELFIRYRRLVFSYIHRNGGSDADAEDMLQEAIIVLWQKVGSGKFELDAQISTFILAVAKNKWMAELRRRRKISGEEVGENRPDGNPTSLEHLLSREQTERVHRALERISPLCKKLLLLFYFEEKGLEEIARRLHFANSDVAKSKKYQCKKSLEAALVQIMAEGERGI